MERNNDGRFLSPPSHKSSSHPSLPLSHTHTCKHTHRCLHLPSLLLLLFFLLCLRRHSKLEEEKALSCHERSLRKRAPLGCDISHVFGRVCVCESEGEEEGGKRKRRMGGQGEHVRTNTCDVRQRMKEDSRLKSRVNMHTEKKVTFKECCGKEGNAFLPPLMRLPCFPRQNMTFTGKVQRGVKLSLPKSSGIFGTAIVSFFHPPFPLPFSPSLFAQFHFPTSHEENK